MPATSGISYQQNKLNDRFWEIFLFFSQLTHSLDSPQHKQHPHMCRSKHIPLFTELRHYGWKLTTHHATSHTHTQIKRFAFAALFFSVLSLKLSINYLPPHLCSIIVGSIKPNSGCKYDLYKKVMEFYCWHGSPIAAEISWWARILRQWIWWLWWMSCFIHGDGTCNWWELVEVEWGNCADHRNYLLPDNPGYIARHLYDLNHGYAVGDFFSFPGSISNN